MSRGGWRGSGGRAAVVGSVWLAVFVTVKDLGAWAQTRAQYEAPRTLRARDLMPAERLQGPGYQVDDTVPTDGFLATFTVRSDHRVFVAAPVDYVAWTAQLHRFASRKDLAAKERSLWLSGQLTPLARMRLTEAGWGLHERALAAPR
jgi:hypothetical protein